LVVVGSLMFSELGNIDYTDKAVKYATFFIVLIMPLTYSITNGLMAGAFVYTFVMLVEKKILPPQQTNSMFESITRGKM